MMIGILLTIFFLFAFPLLVKYLGIEWYELFNAQNIFARIGELMNQILNVGSEAKNYYTQNGSFDLKNSMDTTSQSVDYTL